MASVSDVHTFSTSADSLLKGSSRDSFYYTKNNPIKSAEVQQRWAGYRNTMPKAEIIPEQCTFRIQRPNCACNGCQSQQKLTLIRPDSSHISGTPIDLLTPRGFQPATASVTLYNNSQHMWSTHPEVIIDTGSGLTVVGIELVRLFGWTLQAPTREDISRIEGIGGYTWVRNFVSTPNGCRHARTHCAYLAHWNRLLSAISC